MMINRRMHATLLLYGYIATVQRSQLQLRNPTKLREVPISDFVCRRPIYDNKLGSRCCCCWRQ